MENFRFSAVAKAWEHKPVEVKPMNVSVPTFFGRQVFTRERMRDYIAEQTLEQLVSLDRFNPPVESPEGPAAPAPHPAAVPAEKPSALIVRIFSFSYKKGIPADESGNGGGYVFDCRSTHNPGRYEPYKQLTGLDAPVIKFLEDDGEILTFLQSVYALADTHVARYLERGFTSLMFSFGCTGGQHRSVYSAQHLAEHLHRKFGIEVRLCHREQGITQVLPAKQ